MCAWVGVGWRWYWASPSDNCPCPPTPSLWQTDFFFACATRRAARAIVAAGVDLWLYQFTQELPWASYPVIGDYHSSEVPFVFNNPTKQHFFNAPCKNLSAGMQTYWTSMSIAGNPNGPQAKAESLLEWPVYAQASGWKNMNLTWPLRTAADLKGDVCDFWDVVFGQWLNE